MKKLEKWYLWRGKNEPPRRHRKRITKVMTGDREVKGGGAFIWCDNDGVCVEYISCVIAYTLGEEVESKIGLNNEPRR